MVITVLSAKQRTGDMGQFTEVKVLLTDPERPTWRRRLTLGMGGVPDELDIRTAVAGHLRAEIEADKEAHALKALAGKRIQA